MRREFDLRISQWAIHIEEYLFITPHLTQISGIVLPDNMWWYTIERPIPPSTNVRIVPQFSVNEMRCIKLCFRSSLSETLSVMYCDIEVLHSLVR